jgi:hypothetical protein
MVDARHSLRTRCLSSSPAVRQKAPTDFRPFDLKKIKKESEAQITVGDRLYFAGQTTARLARL